MWNIKAFDPSAAEGLARCIELAVSGLKLFGMRVAKSAGQLSALPERRRVFA